MPNGFAYLMLALWPIVTIVIFQRFPPGKAIVICLLSGYLLLPPPPAQFDLALIPVLNKETIPNLSALVVCFFMYGARMRLLPQNRLGKLLLLMFVLSPLATAMNNGEPIVNGAFFIQGLGIKEGLSMALGNALSVVPFVLAMNFLTTDKDLRYVLVALLVAGLAYSLPMLLEVRLSPQINIWVYGYFQHSFEQMMRGDGFRPIVFLQHGLWVAFFALMATLAAFTLFKSDRSRDPKVYLMAGVYLAVVLVLCKSLGSILFAILLLPMVIFLGLRMQVRIALLMMIVALVYPVMKGNNLIPQRAILLKVADISYERAYSLQFRMIHEAVLLERAQVKPLLGWGTFGRGLVHDQNGRLLSIPDGRWVIVLGAFGWVGYIAEFGLLALSGFMMWWRVVKQRPIRQVPPWIGGLMLILGVNMIDMLPNATLTPLTWMISGAVLGYAMSAQVVKRRQMRVQSVI
ncbi:hypothetical protein ACFQ3C_10525 [Seohaeicola saemankumensis]|uniref:O-antigen ligase like membrane protein n=1 Tax=Seohaeicola saemankumensis TaxID=481181 RepID=A0ABW3TD42_9RHOB